MNRVAAGVLLVLLATPALAHTGAGAAGFGAGLWHPLLGLDHLLAMVAVGLLAGSQRGAAVWLWPASFVAAMVAGGSLALNGVGLSLVEPMVLASVLVLGAMLVAGVRPALPAGVGLVGLLALFHGHAHGSEIAEGASGIAYAAGFALSTAVLHGAGVLLALGTRPAASKALGAAITAGGLGLALLG